MVRHWSAIIAFCVLVVGAQALPTPLEFARYTVGEVHAALSRAVHHVLSDRAKPNHRDGARPHQAEAAAADAAAVLDTAATTVTKSTFGTAADVVLWTLTDPTTGVKAAISSLGATLTSLLAPDARGALDDVVLGFDDADAYRTNAPYVSVSGLFCGSVGLFDTLRCGPKNNFPYNYPQSHTVH